jgi:hypothetical protein
MKPTLFAALWITLVLSATSCSKDGERPKGADATRTATSSKQTVPPELQVVKEQVDRLFKLSLPKGWQWQEQPGKVTVSDPQTGNGISIQFDHIGTHPDSEVRELLKVSDQAMIDRFVKPSGGTQIQEEERQLGGAYARQLTFLKTLHGQQGTVTYISSFAKGYAFTVTFGGSDKNQVKEMRACVETLRFD